MLQGGTAIWLHGLKILPPAHKNKNSYQDPYHFLYFQEINFQYPQIAGNIFVIPLYVKQKNKISFFKFVTFTYPLKKCTILKNPKVLGLSLINADLRNSFSS